MLGPFHFGSLIWNFRERLQMSQVLVDWKRQQAATYDRGGTNQIKGQASAHAFYYSLQCLEMHPGAPPAFENHKRPLGSF